MKIEQPTKEGRSNKQTNKQPTHQIRKLHRRPQYPTRPLSQRRDEIIRAVRAFVPRRHVVDRDAHERPDERAGYTIRREKGSETE